MTENGVRKARAGLARWGLCLAAVLVLHTALLMHFRHLHSTGFGAPTPPPAVLLDLAPPEPPTAEAAPPAPAKVSMPPPQPLPPEVAPPEKPPSQPPQPPPPDVALPEPRPPPVAMHEPPPRPVPRRPQPRLAQSASTRPPAPTPSVAAAVAPSAALAPPPAQAGAARGSWESAIAVRLSRFKNYPVLAQRRGEEGVALLRIVVDRSGRLLGATLQSSSGHADLDRAAADWVERAQPLPAPPDDVAGTRIELVVPLRFTLR